MRKYEKVQQDVLSSVAKNQLVSAGAGSGKTTVMIEKIFNLLTKDNVDLDNILVVTFTVLASKEMKERLHKSILNELQTSDNKDMLYKILDKLTTANIDTIDGFASKTIKKYFYELNISPNIEIISDTTRDYYLSKAINKTIREFAQNKNDAMLFLDMFGGNRRNFESIKEMLLSSYKNVINIEDYEKFFIVSKNEYIDGLLSEKVVNDYIISQIDDLNKTVMSNYSYLCEDTKKVVDCLLNGLNKFDKNLSLATNLKLLKNFGLPSMPRNDKSEEIKEIKNKISDLLETINELEKNKIDENFLNGQAQAYIGTHDFKAFCSAGSTVEDTVRTVKSFSVTRDGEEVLFTVEADGFLYNMVRIMVGSLIEISENKIKKDTLADIIESGDRTLAGRTAPGHGLYLNKVRYEEG